MFPTDVNFVVALTDELAGDGMVESAAVASGVIPIIII